ncbi:MAG: DUF1292 domain-containing protein [Eubacteriales bacterium]|nr:DUF1292 domain-containing protein [Eubacteriales bacterium]
MDNTIVLKNNDYSIEVEVIDQTVVDGISYLLVSNKESNIEENNQKDCFILKDISKYGSEEATYSEIDEEESIKIYEIFKNKLLSDDIILS